MKRITIIIIAFASLFLSACSTRTLEKYMPQIEDSIRGELSAANFIYCDANSKIDKGISIIGSLLDHLGYTYLSELTSYLKSDNLGDKLCSLHIDNGLSFREALIKLAHDDSSPDSQYAEQMLELYHGLEISLSNITMHRNTSVVKEWSILEENSNVVFYFRLTGADTAFPTYSCYAEEKSLNHYIANIQPQTIEISEINPVFDMIIDATHEYSKRANNPTESSEDMIEN